MNSAILMLLLIALHHQLLQICNSIDTIHVNESIKDGDVIISSGGVFTLGFFSASVDSRDRYVGIWYTKVPVQNVVWVANRDNPINDSSGVLSISSQGNLVLYDKYRTIPAWSANVSVSSPNNSAATILDSGNFVLVQKDTSRVLWQSFDHLTDVMVPFTKVGVDHKTGLVWSITSWKSYDDPGSGNWTYWLNPYGTPELIISNGLLPRWRSGPWDGYKWNGVPDTRSQIIYGFDTINSNDQTSMGWGIFNTSILLKLYVDWSGFVRLTTWSDSLRKWNESWSMPKEPCDYYGHCGTYGNCDPYTAGQFECTCLPGFEPKSQDDWRLRDGSGGCVRKRGALTCQGEGFIKLSNAKVPDTSLSVVDVNLGLNACEIECLKNCSCTAFTSALASRGIGCIKWYGELIDTRVFVKGGQDLYIRVDAVELAQHRKMSKSSIARKMKLAVPFISSGAVVVVLIIAYLIWLKKRRAQTGRARLGLRIEKEEFDRQETVSLPMFDVDTIITATANFSFENKLGQGGFGPVYKGQLANGQEIAVKRLSATSSQGSVEFKNEVRLISKLQHKNLVRLYGCCVHKSERMLVYEFLPNKSLDFFIFDDSRRLWLDWTRRYEIITGIARGLLYLHQDSRLKIIHRDLKPSNVLLDAAMNPKISDFGMARIFGEDQTEANTNRVVGTYGYMSPEYAMEGSYSVKSDVFSFGVLVLEIITGMKNNSFLGETTSTSLIGHVWDLWREGRSVEVVESSLTGSFHANEVLRCIQIGLLCVQESAEDRPSMSTTVFMLGNDTTTLPSPKKPAFISKRKLFEPDSAAAARIDSINLVTITKVEGR